MTVSSLTSKSGPFACNGVQVVFNFDFDIEVDTDLRVIHTSAVGVETVLNLASQYTVSAGPWPTGGSITTTVIYPTGESITVKRVLPYKQSSDYTPGGLLPPENIEKDLDRAIKLIQQILEISERSLLLPESSTIINIGMPEPDPGKLLIWDATANKLVNASLADLAAAGVLVTPYAETLLDDGNALSARKTLGIATGTFTFSAVPATSDVNSSATPIDPGFGHGNYICFAMIHAVGTGFVGGKIGVVDGATTFLRHTEFGNNAHMPSGTPGASPNNMIELRVRNGSAGPVDIVCYWTAIENQ